MARVVVFVCDGLRPDRIVPSRMPNLSALRDAGVWFRNSRTVFPSETRVAAASFVTGSQPGTHGIVANDFFDPALFAERALATADAGDLARIAEIRGRLLATPTLAERIAAAGKRYAAVSTASPGTSRILADGAMQGEATFWSIHPELQYPASLAAEIADACGPVPEPALPRSDTIAYAARVMCEHVLPGVKPDLAVFWANEPDTSYHYRGIGSPEAAAAEAAVDRALGDVLKAAGDAIVIVLSDHGHITGSEKIDVVERIRAGGFKVACSPLSERELVVIPGSASFVYARGADAERDALAQWLGRQTWCDAVFARGAGLAELGVDGPGAPDLVFTLGASEAVDAHGSVGTCLFDADLPVGGGIHGGLHPRELANVLVVSGGPFKRGAISEAPAGLIDVAPTIAHLLELDASRFAGRVLNEAIDGPEPAWHRIETQAAASRTSRALQRTQCADVAYIDGLAPTTPQPLQAPASSMEKERA
jgi:phosphonoacetate hydrolase